MAAPYRLTRLRRVGNLLITLLTRLGLGDARTHLLTTVGRKGGHRYTTPVQLVLEDGRRWLVSPYGDRGWARNARAAGCVELTRGRRTERVGVEEVDPETAAPVLREYLRTTPIVKPYFAATPDSPLEEFAAEAARHPVFRVVDAR